MAAKDRAMNRAFVKEDDGDGGDALPERPVPAHPNYVTARGLAQLQARVRELAAGCDVLRPLAAEDTGARHKLRALERDLRYFTAQLERAELVAAAPQHDTVHFGARVTVCDEDGKTQQVHIVGDDEADAAAGEISWASPLARALIGAREGDTVTWRRPAGAVQIEIRAVHYAQA
jgi:transcription elongation GreA/GreB family factor